VKDYIKDSININNSKVFIGELNLLNLKLNLNNVLNNVFIICDTNTHKFCLPVLENKLSLKFDSSKIFIMPHGEKNKNFSTLISIINSFSANKLNKSNLIINLGGGVVTDIGGFAASIYKRGVNYINIPTTLLAMTDAAIGGKTAIDFDEIKNQIGTYYDPQSVYIFPFFLNTLNTNHIKSGLAEIIKSGIIGSNEVWQKINDNMRCVNDYSKLIELSVMVKADIVNKDYYDNNLRKILNFGHTIGHALESYIPQKYNINISHGEAIAAGMICELYISNKLLSFPNHNFNTIVNLIQANYSKINFEYNDFDELLEIMLHDKKNTNKNITFSLLLDIGKPQINCYCDAEIIKEALDFYLKNK